MSKPTLYIMLGYPGAGKTTVAKIIQDLTGAKHLWADHVRRKMFGKPRYNKAENSELYERLNQEALATLKSGQSVVFDTSFNYFHDRQHMRRLAKNANADCQLVWLTVDQAIARHRATQNAHKQTTRPVGDMSSADFDRLIGYLELPAPTENYIQMDGTKITAEYVRQQLKL